MLIENVFVFNNLVSYFLGILSSCGALYGYAARKGILPKNIRSFVSDSEAEIARYEKLTIGLQASLDNALKNISPEEAAEITRLAQGLAENGYTEGEALGLGIRIITAAASKGV
jgi:hypothetical protein